MGSGPELQLSVVIPVRNERQNLPVTLAQIAGKLESLGCTYEIVVIDDASDDDSVAIVTEMARTNPSIRGLRNGEHLGIARTFLNGVRSAQGAFVVLIPADLAMDPDQIADYLDAAKSADIVLGIRSDRRDSALPRRLVSEINILLVKALFGMPQRQFNFVAMYRRELFDRMAISSVSVFFHAEILIRARDLGMTISELDVRYVPRRFGRSSTGHPRVAMAALLEMVSFWWRWRQAKAAFGR